MTKAKTYPTETHSMILKAASRRPGLLAIPLPDGLHGAAGKTVIGTLVKLGWLEEVPANPRRKEPLWRETRDEGGLTLIATQAGLEAVGIDPLVCRAVVRAKRRVQPFGAERSTNAVSIRAGTKQAKLIGLLNRNEGASVAEICEATGWQAHTARGAISGGLKKKLGLAVETSTEAGRGRVYRIAAISS